MSDFFYFKKVELTQWIVPILGIPNFRSNSLGILFWDFSSIFEIARVLLICVGVLFPKSPIAYIFLRWSFWYLKLRVLIWFHLNPRNFNSRNFRFWVGTVTVIRFEPKDVEFFCASFELCEKFVRGCPLTQTPMQKLKLDFWGSVHRKLVRVWYYWKRFLKLYNLSYLDLNFIRWVQKS